MDPFDAQTLHLGYDQVTKVSMQIYYYQVTKNAKYGLVTNLQYNGKPIKMPSNLILPRFRRTASIIQVMERHLENKFPSWETVKLI